MKPNYYISSLYNNTVNKPQIYSTLANLSHVQWGSSSQSLVLTFSSFLQKVAYSFYIVVCNENSKNVFRELITFY